RSVLGEVLRYLVDAPNEPLLNMLPHGRTLCHVTALSPVQQPQLQNKHEYEQDNSASQRDDPIAEAQEAFYLRPVGSGRKDSQLRMNSGRDCHKLFDRPREVPRYPDQGMRIIAEHVVTEPE